MSELTTEMLQQLANNPEMLENQVKNGEIEFTREEKKAERK